MLALLFNRASGAAPPPPPPPESAGHGGPDNDTRRQVDLDIERGSMAMLATITALVAAGVIS